MNNKILFLIPILIFLVPGLAYAEVGINFDREQINDKTIQWTSHYNRIWDGVQWVNYIWFEDSNIIKFNSASLSYELNKVDCSFRLFEPLTNNIIIEKYERTLKLDGLDVILGSCQIDNIEPLTDSLKIITTQDTTNAELKTIFDLKAIGFNEWTYEFKNYDIFDSKIFTIIENCLKCEPKKIDGDIIDLGLYYLDTKNNIHNSLKAIEKGQDLNITFETKDIGFFDKGIIDPVFGYTVATVTGLNDTDCNLVVNSRSVNNYIGGNIGPTVCYTLGAYWDITSIPDNSIISLVNIRTDYSAFSGSPTCEIRSMEGNPTTMTDAQFLQDILNGTLFQRMATCDTLGTNYVFTNSSMITDVQNELKEDNEYATGWTVSVYGVSSTLVNIDQIELEISYASPPPINTTQTIDLSNIGDVVNINGLITVNNASFANLTSIKLFVNGTLTNTNSTGQNGTSQYSDKITRYGPLWYQMLTDQIYNITIQSNVQNATSTYSNYTASYFTREYAPSYQTAIDPAQGTVNYTFVAGNTIQVNRDKGGAIFNIECGYISQSDAFFNNLGNINWDNVSTNAYYSYDYAGYYYVTCYNDGELFTTILNQNYSNFLVPGMVIFDELGGFIGAPSIILVIIAILSLATGRNFPIIIIIAVSVTGIMGALELVTFDPSIWAALIIIAIITVFGARKFY